MPEHGLLLGICKRYRRLLIFFDWNGNGKDDDLFDDMMDLAMLDEMEKENKKSSGNNGQRNTGSCLVMLITMPFWIPLTLILTFLGVIKV